MSVTPVDPAPGGPPAAGMALPARLQRAEAAARAPDDQAKTSSERVHGIARQLAGSLQPLAPGLEFSVDETSGRVLVRVLDRKTNEVIRQIPSEELLALARELDRLQGLLLRQSA